VTADTQLYQALVANCINVTKLLINHASTVTCIWRMRQRLLRRSRQMSAWAGPQPTPRCWPCCPFPHLQIPVNPCKQTYMHTRIPLAHVCMKLLVAP
jgi:hypothetical protein